MYIFNIECTTPCNHKQKHEKLLKTSGQPGTLIYLTYPTSNYYKSDNEMKLVIHGLGIKKIVVGVLTVDIAMVGEFLIKKITNKNFLDIQYCCKCAALHIYLHLIY